VFRLGRTLGQNSDHAHQPSLPRGLWDIHSGHQDDSPRKHFHAISRKCVAFCVAGNRDHLLSRIKPRLFGSCPSHFTPAGPSMAPAGCFLRGILLRSSFEKRRKFRRTRCNLNGGSGFVRLYGSVLSDADACGVAFRVREASR